MNNHEPQTVEHGSSPRVALTEVQLNFSRALAGILAKQWIGEHQGSASRPRENAQSRSNTITMGRNIASGLADGEKN